MSLLCLMSKFISKKIYLKALKLNSSSHNVVQCSRYFMQKHDYQNGKVMYTSLLILN